MSSSYYDTDLEQFPTANGPFKMKFSHLYQVRYIRLLLISLICISIYYITSWTYNTMSSILPTKKKYRVLNPFVRQSIVRFYASVSVNLSVRLSVCMSYIQVCKARVSEGQAEVPVYQIAIPATQQTFSPPLPTTNCNTPSKDNWSVERILNLIASLIVGILGGGTITVTFQRVKKGRAKKKAGPISDVIETLV